MLCRSPIEVGAARLPVPCGQCVPCRINSARVWTARMLLESTQHAHASFLTLTYSPEHLPPMGDLVPRDLQLFLKRFRKAWSAPVRFFAVGEYGSRSFRPHYHAILYGVPRTPEAAKVVDGAWGLGFSLLGSVTPQSIRYVTGYVVKKLRKANDERLVELVDGVFHRHPPEFVRMSRRPGIGAGAFDQIAGSLFSQAAAIRIVREQSLPATVHIADRTWPVGRYGKDRLAAGYGSESAVSEYSKEQRQAELSALRKALPAASFLPSLVDWDKSDAVVRGYHRRESL